MCECRRARPEDRAERFIRSLKENLLWVWRSGAVEFGRRSNATWIVERRGYRTPAQVRADQLGALAAGA